MFRDRIRRRFTAVALFTLVGGFTGSAFALWHSPGVHPYIDVTLSGGSSRIDTVVVSDPSRQEKPDQYILSLSGTSQAAVPDSQFFAVVRVIRGGIPHNVGSDSLVLRPDASAGVERGEVRVLRWLSDSLQIETRNPRTTDVTGASFSVAAERVR